MMVGSSGGAGNNCGLGELVACGGLTEKLGANANKFILFLKITFFLAVILYIMPTQKRARRPGHCKPLLKKKPCWP